MNKLFRNRQNSGITLIALVVTIIVLLILAGVSIATLTGENGILTQASKEKEQTKKARDEEQRQLAQVEAKLSTELTWYTDTSTGASVQVPIPAGFARVNVEGENNIQDGLVIVDENGNEYVWIPCTKTEYENATDQKGTWNQGGYNYASKTWNDKTVEGTISYDDRLASVETYKGFYVARYEAGIPEEMTGVYANTDGANYNRTRNTAEALQYTPVSQKGVQAWNFITQTSAKTVAQKMVTNNKTAQSYLIDSYAWDLVCKKINSKYGAEKNIRDSRTWGNYYNNKTTDYESINTLFAVHKWENKRWNYATNYQKGFVTGAPRGSGNNWLELTTGASEDFKAYNLYDIAGNMWEWTTESTGTNGYAVLRGGSFGSIGGDIRPAVCRYVEKPAQTNVDYVFRSVLYVK